MITPFREDGQLREGFRLSEQSAASSVTYLSEDEVIQKRPGRLYDAWHARMKILEEIDDPEGLLVAAKCSYQLRDGDLWIAYRRHDNKNSQPLEPSVKSFLRVLPEVVATERLLQSAPIPEHLLTNLFMAEQSKVHSIRWADNHIVRRSLQSIGFWPISTMPEVEPLRLSHGDALLKNIISTPLGYRLIDWEALGLYPASMTLAHAISWNLLHLPGEERDNFLDQALSACLDLMGLDEEQARVAIYWQIMREVLFWAKTKDRAENWFAIASGVLA